MGLFSFLFGRKKNKKNSFDGNYKNYGDIEEEKTISVWGAPGGGQASNDTASPWGGASMAKEHIISLTDAANPSKKYTVTINSTVTIGRDSSTCDIVVDYDKFISRKHAVIGREGNDYYVEDLESANGTFKGEKQVADCAVGLKDGDMVKFGRTSFIFNIVE